MGHYLYEVADAVIEARFFAGSLIPCFIHDGNRVTDGGISSGLDEALWLVTLLFGEEMAKEVQATTQYFPDPLVHGALTQVTCCPVRNWPQNPKPCE